MLIKAFCSSVLPKFIVTRVFYMSNTCKINGYKIVCPDINLERKELCFEYLFFSGLINIQQIHYFLLDG